MKAIKLILLASLFFFLFGKFANAQATQFEWAKSISGPERQVVLSLATDGFGNVYTSGYFDSIVDFDPSPDTFNLTSFGQQDIYILKLDPEGNFLWAKQIQRSDNNARSFMAVDSIGNVYSTGQFRDTVDFDPGSGVVNLIPTQTPNLSFSNDFYIQKLDPDGNFLWVKQIGGENSEQSYWITIDQDDNILVTGYFNDVVDFDTGNGTLLLDANEGEDAFILKLDSDGNSIWVKQLKGTGTMGEFITLDDFGNTYVTGHFYEKTDFNPGSGIFNLSSSYDSGFEDYTTDAFILKLDSQGNFAWAKKFGTDNYNYSITAAAGSIGNVYITGSSPYFDYDLNPGSDTFYLNPIGEHDMFIIKLDVNGDFVWAKKISGNDGERGNSIDLDSLENIYITGSFSGKTDFDPGVDSFHLTSNGSNDIFVQKLNQDGELVWVKQMGGTGQDNGSFVTLDFMENIYISGLFSDTVDFNPGPEIATLNSIGNRDIFIQKISPCGFSANVSSDLGFEICMGQSITLTANGGSNYLWNTGDTSATITVNPLSTTTFYVAITNTFDCTLNQPVQVIVNPSPYAQFDYNTNQNIVEFINLSGAPATGFQWNFGDNSPESAEENPVYIYDQPGVYLVTLVATNPLCGSAISQYVEVLSTGTKTINHENLIKIFPNPANDLLTIKSEIEIDIIQISNALGQQILEIKEPKHIEEIKLNHFPAGSYLITFISKDQIWSMEFLKQ